MTETTAQAAGTNTQTISSSISIQPIAEFNPNTEIGASLATRWTTWLDDFEMFLLASGIQDTKRQQALLLYQAGSRVREILRQLKDTGEDDDYERAKTKLTEYFEPQKNRRYEVYKFREAKQETTETLDHFHTRLRKLAQTCAFNDADFEIEQQIIMAGTSSRIRKKALRDPDYTLKDILIDGRRDEQSRYQAHDIESKDQTDGSLAPIQLTRHCYYCGGSYPHQGVCPAKGKSCRKCGKQNHFPKVCRGKYEREPPKRDNTKRHSKKPGKRPINPLKPNESDQSDSNTEGEDYLYNVRNKKPPQVRVTVCKSSFEATIYTGATINVIDKSTYNKMDGVHLKKTNIKAFAYMSDKPVRFIGKFEAIVETRKRVTVATFYVANKPDSGNLISASTAQELGLISLHVHSVSPSTGDKKIDQILHQHANVFHGLGKLKGEQIKLNIDASYPPKAQPQRRIPFHVREKVKAELEQLENSDIIERVPESQPTPWVSPVVVVPKKDGGVRLCVDMRQANSAINCVRHPIPTVDDIRLELNGAKWFSKLDLSQAYHQLELEENSRYITTFTTHEGLFRYKRLNYGTNAAAEIFQFTLQQQLRGLHGVRNIADDIIVYGKTREDHDANLEKCLQRLSDKGLRLNQSKCTFLNKTLDFFGQVFSEGGTKPDPKRVRDLREAPTPTSIHDVRSLLGMANYSSRYIANFATITAPLRELTKKNTQFEWQDIHQKAFEKLTSALSASECMAYFDMQKDTFITVDASPVGLSAILSQKTPGKDDEKVVAYASRALTAVEKRYAQTECEALAIVWGVEHFHLFVYGKEFTLITDHKPLEVIYGNRNAKSSARVECWVLRLQPYSFKVVYKPGSTNPADYLSRHPIKPSYKQQRMTEEYVNFIALNSVPKAMTIEEIIKATDEDQVLKGVRAAIKINNFDYDIVKPFKHVKDELSVTTKGIILRGSRIVIPKSLQQKAIDIAHECHLGLTKTKETFARKNMVSADRSIGERYLGEVHSVSSSWKVETTRTNDYDEHA